MAFFLLPRRLRRQATVALLLLAVAIGYRSAYGYAFITNDAGVPLHWQSTTIPMKVIADNTTHLSDGNTRAGAIVAAMTDASRGWNHYLGGIQFVPQVVTTGQGFDADLINEAFFTPTAYTYNWDTSTLAITTAWYTGDKRLEADVLFNTNPPNSWDSYRGSLKTGEVFDIERVALHELGHVLGLDHPDEHGQTVSAVMNSIISDTDSLQADDIAGAQVLYGAPGVGPANDNFANATTVSFTGSSTVAFSGTGITTAGATKEADEPAHAGDPGGHSVWWKYTAAQNGTLTVDTTGSNFDTLLGVYTGSTVANLTSVAANDDWSANSTGFSEVTVSVTVGTTYYIAVDGKGGDFGALVVTFNLVVPVLPNFSSNPSPQTVIAGQTAVFSANANGSPAPTLHWQRLPSGSGTWADLSDGSDYSNTSTSNLWVNAATVGMTGDQFRCVATNAAGAVMSAPASLTVLVATPPTVSISGSSSFNYGDTFSIYASVGGSQPITLQWYKDGVAVVGQVTTNFWKPSATTGDSGSYTVAATNAGGTVTSAPFQVTVNPAVAPQITRQPVSLFAAPGDNAVFSVGVTGIPAPICQWYCNGVPVGYVGQTTLSFSPVSSANAGSYYAILTNVAGSVQTNTVTLTLTPPIPPLLAAVENFPISITPGASLSLNAGNPGGTPPFSYQWFKDGAPIAGATSAGYSKSNVTAADAGDYFVEVTNASGMDCSPDMFVTLASATAPWISSARLGDVVYFLYSSPGVLRRYSLAQESWLPDVALTNGLTPTAFVPTSDGVFLAYGATIVFRPPDLQTETVLATAAVSVTDLFAQGGFVYYQDQSGIKSIRSSDRTAGPAFAATFWAGYGGYTRPARPVFSTKLNCGFTSRPQVSPDDIIKIVVATDGSFPSDSDSPYHGNFQVGARQYLSPDESLLFDSSGVAYRTTDLTYARTIGTAFDDLAFLDDGRAVVLRGAQLQLLDSTHYLESGRSTLAASGLAVFCRAGSIYVFGAPTVTANPPVVTKVDPSTLLPAAPTVPSSPQNLRFSLDGVFVDPTGVMNVVSRSGQALFRWDPVSTAFTTSVPLRGRPLAFSYDWGNGRAVLDYTDGAFTNVRFAGDGNEHVFGWTSEYNWQFAFVTMDDLVEINLHDAGDTGDARVVVDAQGATAYWSNAGLYSGAGLDWEPVTQRLYSFTAFSNHLGYENVPTTGILPGQHASSASVTSPVLRFKADGSEVFSLDGTLFDENLNPTGNLGLAVLDAAWLEDSVATLRRDATGTLVELWPVSTLAPNAHASVPGYPVAIRSLPDDGFVVVTSIQGYLGCFVFDANFNLTGSFINSSTVSYGPAIAGQPQGSTVAVGGSASLTVHALSSATPTYQWQRLGAGGAWNNLVDGGSYSGAQSFNLVVTATDGSFNGAQFRCVVSSAAGSSTSDAVTLQIRGSAVDFNADGKTDLVWTNTTTGDRSVWFMNGTAIDSFGYLANIDPVWHIVGTGDFNADGKTDLVWENLTTGDRTFWQMNGTAIDSFGYLAQVDAAWHIAAIGDFNADGKPDVIWENTSTGDRAVWYLNGQAIGSFGYIAGIPTDWHIVGAADFDGDGQTDLVWENLATGDRTIWYMNGATLSGFGYIANIPGAWHIATVTDIDGDGHPDLVWENTVTGDRAIWLMSNATLLSSPYLASIDPVWRINP